VCSVVVCYFSMLLSPFCGLLIVFVIDFGINVNVDIKLSLCRLWLRKSSERQTERFQVRILHTCHCLCDAFSFCS